MTDSMSPHQALRAAVEWVGSGAAFARLLSVSQPSVWKWLTHGKPLPARFVLLVEATTGISRYLLRPDVYGQAKSATNAEAAR